MTFKKILKLSTFGLVLAMSGLRGFPQSKLRVLTSILPLKEFAAAVAGERAEVELLLPPGTGVHTWQLRPGDILKLKSSDLFIFIGADLEPWIPQVLGAASRESFEILEASRGLSLLESGAPGEDSHGHGEHDPHLWLDFELDIRIVDRIESVLKRLDPGATAYFEGNAEVLRTRLRDLDTRFRTGLSGCGSRDLVVAGHGAFAYLARRYGLNQKAVYGVSPDSQPRPRQFMELIDYCRRENIRTVFFENSVPQDTARVLAKEIGGRIMTLNAGHNLTGEQLKNGLGFFDLMEENLRNLKEGLSCR